MLGLSYLVTLAGEQKKDWPRRIREGFVERLLKGAGEIRAIEHGGLRKLRDLLATTAAIIRQREKAVLPCRYNACHTSELMLPELGPYLAMWNLISTEVYKGKVYKY